MKHCYDEMYKLKDCKPHPDSDSVWKYYEYGKDVFGRKVYAAFLFGEFAGFRYRRTDREIKQIKGGAKNLGVPRWVECPIDSLPPDLIPTCHETIGSKEENE